MYPWPVYCHSSNCTGAHLTPEWMGRNCLFLNSLERNLKTEYQVLKRQHFTPWSPPWTRGSLLPVTPHSHGISQLPAQFSSFIKGNGSEGVSPARGEGHCYTPGTTLKGRNSALMRGFVLSLRAETPAKCSEAHIYNLYMYYNVLQQLLPA